VVGSALAVKTPLPLPDPPAVGGLVAQVASMVRGISRGGFAANDFFCNQRRFSAADGIAW
jgi:hypothetical protein